MTNLNTLFDKNQMNNGLVERFKFLKQEEPKLRRKDVADKLNVAEAALIDHQCGVQSVRLSREFKTIIEQLPSLGYIMSLTRNKAAVHERKGEYSNVKITGAMGLILTVDRKIDLRIILPTWAFGFAVAETTDGDEMFSLQFFDGAGVAIQKIYLQPESNREAYAKLVMKFKDEDQQTALTFAETPSKKALVEDSHVDTEKLIEDWQKMNNVHQFMGILRHHKITREQAFRLTDEFFAQPIPPDVLESVLIQAAETQLPIMCFVGNHGNIQIHSGPIKNINTVGPWLNVLDPEFNLHLLQDAITSAWLIRKPTTDGMITSLEFYDIDSETVVQFFGLRHEGSPENSQWRALAESTLIEEEVIV